jgi:hypothetical protein
MVWTVFAFMAVAAIALLIMILSSIVLDRLTDND